MDSYPVEIAAKLRVRDLEREVSQIHLRTDPNCRPLSIVSRFSYLIGGLAIDFGCWLQSKNPQEESFKACRCSH